MHPLRLVMSVIASLSIRAEDFTLGTALTPHPGLRVSLERVVPLEGNFIPYLWVANDAIEEIEAELFAAAAVAAVTVVDRVNDEALVRIEWTEDIDGFLEAVAETDAMILEGVGEANRWRFQLRFADHEALTAFYHHCAEAGIPLELESVYNPGTPQAQPRDLDLTDPQRETLELALRKGYFDVPRTVDIVELADELGVSDSAVSQRLRRGIEGMLLTTLGEDHDRE